MNSAQLQEPLQKGVEMGGMASGTFRTPCHPSPNIANRKLTAVLNKSLVYIWRCGTDEVKYESGCTERFNYICNALVCYLTFENLYLHIQATTHTCILLTCRFVYFSQWYLGENCLNIKTIIFIFGHDCLYWHDLYMLG